MNEKKLKDLLNKELSSKVPELDDKILSTPIGKPVEQNVDVEFSFSAKEKFLSILKSRKVWSYTAAIACVLIVAILAVIYVPGFISGKENNEEVYSCYVVDINPSISVTTDSNGNVVSMSSVNSDGDLVLSNDDVSNSKTIDEWLQNVITTATNLGYIDASSTENAVKISAINSDGSNMDSVLAEKKELMLSTMLDKGIFGIVVTQQASKDEFANRFNITANNEKDFINGTKDRPIFEFEQGDIDAKINQIKDDNMNKFAENIKTTIGEVSRLYRRFNEIDLAIKDLYNNNNRGYFYVKDDKDASEEVVALIKEGDSILEDLNENYSCEITEYMTIDILGKTQVGLCSEKLDLLNNYIQNADVRDFDLRTIDEVVIEVFGEDSVITKLVKSGNLSNDMDKDKFFEFEKDALKGKIEARIDEYKVINEEHRDKIDQKEYDDYLNSILEKYGKLENYYENLKNHQ